jgi:ferrous iron transport protein A
MPIVPLELLHAGQQGRICDLDGSDALVHRLKEMGLREGALVEMVRPGSPCILAVDHHRFSLRLDEAATVLVEVDE